MNSTYIFKDTLTTETEFIPMQTIESEELVGTSLLTLLLISLVHHPTVVEDMIKVK